MLKTLGSHVRANLVGYFALFLVLTTGSAVALNGSNTVFSDDIVNGEVKTPDLGANSVATGKIADGQVTAPDLGANSVNSSKVTDNSLTGADINESTLVLASGGSWKLAGNAGTTGSDFLGTTDNQPLNLRVNNARSLRLEPASDGTNPSPNVIGGTADNSVTAGVLSATIGGGGRGTPSDPASANRVTDNQGTVGGGANNQAGDGAGTVADRTLATVGGGSNNSATGQSATVGGGFSGIASGNRATVGGGNSNIASGDRATVPGGSSNTAQGNFSLAAGRDAQANHPGAFVWADSRSFIFPSTAQDQFSVRSTGGARLVSAIDGSGNPASGLELPAGGSGWSTLVNGQPFDIRVNGSRGLRIDPASDGGFLSPNVIGGVADNTVTPGVFAATIGGGGRIFNSDPSTANKVLGSFGTIGGGGGNEVGDAAAINPVMFGTVAGGVSNRASGSSATVGGGISNTASGPQSAVPGGSSNTASAAESFAAGRRAKSNHNGAFVWADSNNLDFASTAQNQFSVRSTGGVRFVSAVNSTDGTPTAGVTLAPGGGSWASLSDQASKTAVTPVSGRGVLRKLASVPISEWSYRAQGPSIRHIGPMAQDLSRAFGVGEDPRHITSVDADGISLAAIKALNEKVRTLQRQVGVPAGDSAGPSGDGSSLPVWALVALAMLGLAGAAALGGVVALRWQRALRGNPATG